MFLLAWRHALLDPVRTLLTGLALGAVVAVILVLEGFEQRQYDPLEQAVLEFPGPCPMIRKLFTRVPLKVVLAVVSVCRVTPAP